MSTHRTVSRISVIVALWLGLSLAISSHAVGKEKPKFDLPAEIRNLSKSVRPKPPRTVLDFDSTSRAIADTAVAVVWLKFRSSGDGELYDIDVVFSSHPGYGLEERAIQALKAASFEPKSISGKKADKWLYYEVAFDRTFFRNNTTPLKDWSPDIDSTEHTPLPDEFVPVEVLPEMIYQAPPTYPRLALAGGLTGTVWIKVLVNTAGDVEEALVAKTSGHSLLDKSALDVAYKNKFRPGLIDGKPVSCWATYRIDFNIESQ